ncbi:hypothetical protein ACSSUQ_004236 [Yersinia enterocolitica]
MGSDKEYVIQPFTVGMSSIDKFESEEVVIIDIITREEIAYCEPNCYLISDDLLKTLIKNNVDCVNILKNDDMNIKFSILHNMKFQNKRVPRWNRMIAFKKDYDKKEFKEIYINSDNELVINQRVLDLIKKHRVKRALIQDHKNEIESKIVEEEKAQPIYKLEKNNNLRSTLIFVVIMSLIAYWFFK